jgi:predicted kinase
LFGQYSIDEIGHEEHTRRVLACRELIWSSAAELLRRSVDVILDDGFFFREHRVRHVRLADEAGASAKIHFIDTPLAIVQARLERRNTCLPAYNFHVSPGMLQAFAGLFEIPSDREGSDIVIVRPQRATSM